MNKRLIQKAGLIMLATLLFSCTVLSAQPAQASLLSDTLKTYAETYITVKLYYEYAFDHWQGFFKNEYARVQHGRQ